MATFREIDERILSLVDEDGEILDLEAFQELQMARDLKIESMALFALDLRDEQACLDAEIKRLETKKAAAKRKEQSLRDYIRMITGGEKMRTPMVSISYRSTPAVEISDEDDLRRWAMTDDRYEDVLRYKEPEISKTEVKRLIQEGVNVPGASIVTRISTLIK